MSAAFNAILHMIIRVQEDPDFAWHMMGTESWSRCLTAYAEHTGMDEEKVRQDLEAKIGAMQKKKKTRIAQLEEQIELLEDSEAETEQASADLIRQASKELDRALQELRCVKDLVQYCTFRNAPLSVAAVELALQGKSLGRCLHELESVGV